MTFKLPTRTKETSTTTGTGAVTLAGAVTPPLFRTFNAALGVNNTTAVMILDAFGNWEASIATLTSAAVLARGVVIASSNAGALVNFPAGEKTVFAHWPEPSAATRDQLLQVLGLGLLPDDTWVPTNVGESGWTSTDTKLTFKRKITGGAIKGARFDLEDLV